MSEAQQINEQPAFARLVKKLHSNQKTDLFVAIRELAVDPEKGERKIGDINGVRVYKFRMAGQLTLLAYLWDEPGRTITLLFIGSHENFYRDLKR